MVVDASDGASSDSGTDAGEPFDGAPAPVDASTPDADAPDSSDGPVDSGRPEQSWPPPFCSANPIRAAQLAISRGGTGELFATLVVHASQVPSGLIERNGFTRLWRATPGGWNAMIEPRTIDYSKSGPFTLQIVNRGPDLLEAGRSIAGIRRIDPLQSVSELEAADLLQIATSSTLSSAAIASTSLVHFAAGRWWELIDLASQSQDVGASPDALAITDSGAVYVALGATLFKVSSDGAVARELVTSDSSIVTLSVPEHSEDSVLVGLASGRLELTSIDASNIVTQVALGATDEPLQEAIYFDADTALLRTLGSVARLDAGTITSVFVPTDGTQILDLTRFDDNAFVTVLAPPVRGSCPMLTFERVEGLP